MTSVSKGFMTSFQNREEGKPSFLERYPFLKNAADKLNVELMTMDDLIPFYATKPDFIKQSLDILKSGKYGNNRSIQVLINQISTFGFLGEASRLLGESGTVCVKASSETLTKDDKKVIDELARFVEKDDKWYTKPPFKKSDKEQIDWKEVCTYYSQVWQNPEGYGFSRPGSAIDFLKSPLFAQLMGSYLLARFVKMCAPRGGTYLAKFGQGIGDEYIASIIENGISDVNFPQERTDIIVLCVSKVEPYNIVSFIAAEKGKDNDVHGELVCTDPQAESGLGKLQLAATLLAAKDSGVEFVFIQAISGLFGVQAALYGRFGFETEFPEKLLKRRTAMEQYIGVRIEKSTLAIWHEQYAKKKTFINWLLSSPSRTMAAITLIPMWIYAPTINPLCIKNMLEKSGWDCREGEPMGVGAPFRRGDTRNWTGLVQKLIGWEPRMNLPKGYEGTEVMEVD
jgi:hypothetical protein